MPSEPQNQGGDLWESTLPFSPEFAPKVGDQQQHTDSGGWQGTKSPQKHQTWGADGNIRPE